MTMRSDDDNNTPLARLEDAMVVELQALDGFRHDYQAEHPSAQLHREDRGIRAEERGMAAEHGGHITGRDQRILNRQENAVSNQIYNERH